MNHQQRDMNNQNQQPINKNHSDQLNNSSLHSTSMRDNNNSENNIDISQEIVNQLGEGYSMEGNLSTEQLKDGIRDGLNM